MTHVTIYGAVTPPRVVESSSGVKTYIKQLATRLRFRAGSLANLDYRDHVTRRSFNRGDLAISLATSALLIEVSPGIELSHADWGLLSSLALDDPIVVSGSGFFHLKSNGNLTDRAKEDLQTLLTENRKFALFGVGVNRTKESSDTDAPAEFAMQDVAVIRRLLTAAAFVSVRDLQSLRALQPHTHAPIFLSGDPALFLQPSFSTHYNKVTPTKRRIGVNIPFHGPAASDRVREDLPKYIECFRQLQATTDCELVQLIHFDAERIVGQLMQDAGVKLTQVDGSVESMQSAYATLDLHVGGMLHSCILACSVGTPCVALAYDVKHFGFFELMGIPEYCVPAKPFDATNVLERCNAALRQREFLRRHIESRRDELRTQTADYLRENLPKLLRFA